MTSRAMYQTYADFVVFAVGKQCRNAATYLNINFALLSNRTQRTKPGTQVVFVWKKELIY